MWSSVSNCSAPRLTSHVWLRVIELGFDGGALLRKIGRQKGRHQMLEEFVEGKTCIEHLSSRRRQAHTCTHRHTLHTKERRQQRASIAVGYPWAIRLVELERPGLPAVRENLAVSGSSISSHPWLLADRQLSTRAAVLEKDPQLGQS